MQYTTSRRLIERIYNWLPAINNHLHMKTDIPTLISLVGCVSMVRPAGIFKWLPLSVP